MALHEQLSYLGHQVARPVRNFSLAEARNGMGTHKIRKVGHSKKSCICLCSPFKDVGDYGGRGDSLVLQRYSVVHTARRATPSISHSRYHNIGVLEELGSYLRLGRQCCGVLLRIKYVGKLKLLVQYAGYDAQNELGIDFGVVQEA